MARSATCTAASASDLIGIGLIAGGSVVCALPNVGLLIAGRAITRIGAALDVPISLAILIVAYHDPRERNFAIGIWASWNGIAIALGPTIGGLLVDIAGWRSIFALFVPLCLLTMALAWRFALDRNDPGFRTLDPAGQGLAIVAIGTLAFIAIEGPHIGLASPIVLTLGTVLVLSSTAFFIVEHRTKGAMVGLLLLTPITTVSNLLLIEAALLIIGLGLNTAPGNAVAVAAVPRHRAGTASGLVNTLRMIGATLGIAVLGTIYAVYTQSGSPEQTIAGLRLAFLGGASVELTGAVIAFLFVSADALRRKAV